MSSRSRWGLVLVVLALLGCGGSGDLPVPAPAPAPVRQFGVTEAELYDALHQPAGLVAGPGSGLVMLQLEPVGGPLAPLVGDTATLGVDEMWFDVDQPGTVSLLLNDQNLAQVARLELRDRDGNVLQWADTVQRQSRLQLVAGRYLLRLRAAPTSTTMTPVRVWFGGSSVLTSAADVARLASGNCAGCNLYGAELTQVNLRGVNLVGADLRHALLANMPGGFKLQGTDLMTIYLGNSGSDGTVSGGADLSAANLSSARLDGAHLSGPGSNGAANLSAANLSSASIMDTYLSHANLSAALLVGSNLSRSVLTQAVLRGANLTAAVLRGADLTGADLSAANVVAADFTGATLDGATWPGGHVCASGSLGVCR